MSSEIEKKAKNSVEMPKTVTCLHCRYEYPAEQEHCTLCGHPWPWTESRKKP